MFPRTYPMPGKDVSLYLGDCLGVMRALPDCSIHACVTDPPYGVSEFSPSEVGKLRNGSGGVWRQPTKGRSPVPRFTTDAPGAREALCGWMREVAVEIRRLLVPGGHLLIAANPLLSSRVFCAIEDAGFEKRGEVIRLVQTLRGGDRPKGAEREFPDISVMPRSCWEPWGLFRKPLACRTVAENLRVYGAGGLLRESDARPFMDVIRSAPTQAAERDLAPHPSLKPQALMRRLVRAAMPCGGMLLDPFAGGGSTLAAAAACGVDAVGIERDEDFFRLAVEAVPKLAGLEVAG